MEISNEVKITLYNDTAQWHTINPTERKQN
jgi:hypothetical protein